MTKKSQTNFSILTLCLLGGALYIIVALISPPALLPIDAPATDFSSGRAMQDLDVISFQPHPMGVSEGRAVARDYILGEISELGLDPQGQDTFGIRIYSPGTVFAGAVENILLRLPGTDPEGVILLSAHYDSAPGGSGAGDNGSGVATLLPRSTLGLMRSR